MTVSWPDGAVLPGAGGLTSTGGTSAGSGGATSAGGTTGGCSDCQSLEECWNGQRCVAKRIFLPAGFAIDATEVTRGQYAAWLATNPMTDGQTTGCSSNTSFAGDSTCMGAPSVCQGSDCDSHPQPCVDYCDATEYCKAVGKRLCGDDDWSTACTSNGVHDRTYGSAMVVDACNDYTMENTTTMPVGSNPGCQSSVSGYTGVYDLIGNLAELTEPCATTCKARGLSFGIGATAPMCIAYTYADRNKGYANVGFRCCDGEAPSIVDAAVDAPNN